MKIYPNLKKVLSLVLAFSILLSIIPSFSLNAFAEATISNIEGLQIIDSIGTGSYSNGTVTITATGGTLSKNTNNITIMNVSGKAATLTFNYSIDNADSHTFPAKSGKYTNIINAGESISFSITSPRFKGKVTLTISGISLVPVPDSSIVTFKYDSSFGSITVDGATIGDGESLEIPSSGGSIVATPKSGVNFIGWINYDDGALISKSASHNLITSSNITVSALFTSPSSQAMFIVDDKYYFDNLNVAVTKGSKVVLASDGTLPAGNYTIPSGVTLLIPRDEAATVNEATPNRLEDYTKPTAFRTLMMASGANIVVKGKLNVAGSQCGKMGYNGCVSGPVGFINMLPQSSITLDSGSTLYAWGYITGSGNVEAKSGSTVYESFQLMDFRGGQGSTSMNSSAVFPMSQYYVQNIEVPLKINSGAIEYAYMSAKLSLGMYGASVAVIGNSNTKAMFKLNEGYVIKDFVEETGRLSFDLKGTVSVNPISVSLSIYTVNSEKQNLPIPGHMTIKALEGTNVTMNQNMALLPGSQLYIDEGASCTIGQGINIFVYALSDWQGKGYCYNNKDFYDLHYAPGSTVNPDRNADALVCVNGTVDATNGYVYTTQGIANIYSDGTGVVITKPGTLTNTQMANQTGTDVTIVNVSVRPAVLTNGNAAHPVTDTALLKDKTTTYYYNTDCDMWVTHGATDHNYSEEVTKEPTCTEKGEKTFTCSTCKHSYTEEVDPLGHSYNGVITTDPTCTEKGVKTFTCSACGDFYTVEVDPLGHSYSAVVTAPTCTEQGYTTYTCSQCGDSYVVDYVDATGHNYEAVVTAPTCTTDGYTTYTCHCGYSYVGDYVDATGHDYEAVVTPPTCNDEGYTTYTCHCGDTYTGDKTSALGHKDDDHNHVCDNGCDVYQGTHADSPNDNDHVCDYGCGAVLEECVDTNKDHKCDYGCDKVYGVCEDKDLDHDCDYGCDKTYGEHSDSDDDKDHLCDYCKEKVEECHGGKATCTEDAVCVECGEVYEKALGHSFDNELDVSCNRDGCDFTREAYIGDVSYATFEDALAAAKEGDTIVVLSKIVIEGERTLDLTGITIDSKYVDFDNYAMVVKGNLTINGGSFNFDNYYGIGVTGKLTVNGGKFTTTKDYYLIGNFGETVINGGEFEALYCNVNSFAGTVNITGGKFTVSDYSNPDYPPCDVFAEDGGEAIITGGNFSTDVTNYCPNGHTVENNDGRFIYGEHVYNTVVTAPTCTEKGFTTHTCTVCGDSYTDNETAATGHSFDDDFDADCNNGCGHVRDAKTLVAMIGEIKFDSLTEAVLTAKDGETIVLCKDVTLTEKLVVATTQKWDFGSYTVTLANGDENYSLVVKGDLTIESGTFVVSGWYGIGVTGKLTVNGGTIDYSEYNDYLIGNWAETVINGGTFNGQYCCVNNFAGNTVINGGDFTTELKDATGEYDSYDLMADSGLFVNGGTFSKDVTIYCDNDYHTCDVDGDGRFVYEEHSYDSVVTEPTCTEKGYTTYTCHCGDSYVGDNVDATGHDYAETVTDPTCTKKGYTTHTCTICGDSYTDNETDATGHDYAETVTDPTCTEDGYTTHTCTVCGDSYTDNETDATGHSFDDDFDATCNNGCGHVREAKILVAMIGNTKFDSLSEAVNTAKDGETIVLFKDVVLTEKLNVESTQKWDFGNYTVTLADVNDNYGLVVTGDLTIESGNFVAPGLYGIGVTGKLTVNGGMFKTTKDYYLIGNFGETVINGGEFEALYCNVNSFAGTVNITGGKFTVTDYSYPDYPPSDVFAEDGGEAIITGGDFSTDVTNYCPGGHTVKNDGNRYIYGEHVYTTVVTKPTCTEKGHTTYTCECGDTYVDSYVDANGHKYDAVVTDPTCTEGGYTTHTCTVCGDTYVDSYVDENGHDYDDVVTKPTCTKGGYTTHTCTVCGDTYVDSYVDESGHTHGGYEYDLYKHWSICSVDGCGVRFCEEDHVFIDDACKCGAKRVSVDKVGNTEINYIVIGQTVTVTHEDACTVVYISDGEYVKLDAVVNGDGSYSFTAPENVTEVQLFVIGDYDGNGALTEDDATSLRNALLGKETLNNTPEFIYDVSGDGKVTALDLALISAAAQRSIKLG